MKKLSVLLVAAAVALSASAGVNHKLVNNVKTSVKEVKAMAGQRQTMTIKKGDVNVLPGTALKAFDFNAVATANHAFKADNDIVWDFESEDQLADWMVLDNDGDGFNWQYFNNEGKETGLMTAHSGYGLMASASFDNGTGAALTPDNWLISPVVTLGKSVKLWACGQDASYAAEKFGVFVCIGDPTNINDFVQVGADKTVTGTMTEYGFDLSEYEGQQGCIAIRHYNVTDMFFLNIDDVTISGDEYIPEPEPVAPEVITEIPEGCQVYTYFRNSATIYSSLFGIGGGETDGKFTVAFDVANHEVYIQNPVWNYDSYNTWVKGTYTYGEEGVIITIPTGQYLFWNDSYQYGIVLGMGSTYVYEDVDPESGESGYYLGTELDERATEIQFMIDDDTIYLLNTEGDINAEFPENYNAYGMFCYYSDDQSFSTVEFANRDEYGYAEPFGYMVDLKPAVPANPTADEWYDCGDKSGFSRFDFTLPTTDVDGNMIDPEYLSYSIYVDNGNGPELFTFPAVDYSYDLTEDITEVPYDLYSNAVDFRAGYVYFYRTNAEGFEPLFTQNIGIQVFYTVDGVKNASEIVWLYDVESGVNEMNADKAVASVRYFNVAGQEMAQPSGMTIKVTTYTDGTTSAVKVVK